MVKLRKMRADEIKRMKRNRGEMSQGKIPGCDKFLGQMSLDKASENLQNKLSKFKI